MTGKVGRLLTPDEADLVDSAQVYVNEAQRALDKAYDHRGELWKRLVDEEGVQPADIAKRIGRHRGTVVQAIAVYERGRAGR